MKRRARLFRNGHSQAVRIPKSFEFSGSEVILRKEGDRLIIEPASMRLGLLRALASMAATDERLPDVGRSLRRIDDVEL